MIIAYKRNEIFTNLFFAVFWLVVGTLNIWLVDRLVIGLVWVLLSLLYFIIYTNQVKNQYLTIEEGMIRQNWPWGKKIKLEDIHSITNQGGKYKLKSGLKEMNIRLKLIDGKSLSKLNSELIKLNVIWTGDKVLHIL